MARDDGKQQAMSATRVSVIQARLEAFREALEHRSQLTISISDYTIDVDALLAEVERLRAREAALLAEREQAMEIVRAVANQDCAQDIDDPEWMQCLACGGGGPTGESIEHLDICYYIAARALLASTAEGSGGDGA